MRLGLFMKRWRSSHDTPLRELAKQLGISAATLSRIEQGKQCDATTLMKIFNWLTGEWEK